MVVCGGVNVILTPSIFIQLSKARMLSKTGQCHTFSSKADGYARGEGCGIVLLKRLSDVRIHSCILFNTYLHIVLHYNLLSYYIPLFVSV